ncbi:efflux transporter outer membrane subunit [Rubinisphaera margarita]|uniref:efflux transporter outer membrane subunit n=1 Tax=Rubinisphaera margarita TaxID=2909586 RepID=UPI001EE865FA|nr:efflux transporter outer membrane subunit [Rubinisphaera margarita]MCG6156335.1 efflux transporter outer membrane subunit [Rubinisphaera margarita]
MSAQPGGLPERCPPLDKLAIAATILMVVSLCGCQTGFRQYIKNGFKVGPNYRRPVAPVANDWIDYADPRVNVADADYSAWWTTFNDPTLNHLITSAFSQNLTLREAGLRVMEFEYQRNVVAGNIFPQQQELFGDYTRNLRSGAFGPGPRSTSTWRFGSRLAWELDFWGRFRRAIERADAQLDSSIENYDDVLVLLLAETATTYVDFRTTEQRLQFARQNVELQTESARIAARKLDAGAKGGEIDAPQAAANLAQTRAIMEELEISLRQSRNRLCVLLGMPPHDLECIMNQNVTSGVNVIPRAPREVVIDVPAALLLRRPDVRRAEREAAAQNAEIGIAESSLYPHISINGSLSLEAPSFGGLFGGDAWAGSIGPAFRWDVLNYGRLRNNIYQQDVRFQQLVTRYQQTVLLANEEAENAIVAFLRFQNEAVLLEESVREASEAVRVATVNYDEGEFDFNRLFTLQQFLVSLQDQLAVVQGNVCRSLIQLYRALGGGWELRLRADPRGSCPPGNTQLPEFSLPDQPTRIDLEIDRDWNSGVELAPPALVVPEEPQPFPVESVPAVDTDTN